MIIKGVSAYLSCWLSEIWKHFYVWGTHHICPKKQSSVLPSWWRPERYPDPKLWFRMVSTGTIMCSTRGALCQLVNPNNTLREMVAKKLPHHFAWWEMKMQRLNLQPQQITYSVRTGMCVTLRDSLTKQRSHSSSCHVSWSTLLLVAESCYHSTLQGSKQIKKWTTVVRIQSWCRNVKAHEALSYASMLMHDN